MKSSFTQWTNEKIRKYDLRDRVDRTLERDPFSAGKRPVIRWIKGDGLDDVVTQAAIAQATRLFGDQVDYCLLTQGIAPDRAREVLSWATQPVEWRPISGADNPWLQQTLFNAGCDENDFGYWWKWFPERVRPDAPEWILDGDMVILKRPPWFEEWISGRDRIRVSQFQKLTEEDHIYGRYEDFVDPEVRLYSGLISLPAKLSYLEGFKKVLNKLPLQFPHNGKRDMCEQGVVAATFQEFDPIPIPLEEFPFARGYEMELDFGDGTINDDYWGVHFGNAFVMKNVHFHAKQDLGEIVKVEDADLFTRFRWLSGGIGQWGFAGWGMSEEIARIIVSEMPNLPFKRILEIGTSRGYMAAILAAHGALVTAIDVSDRGAKKNLEGLTAIFQQSDALEFLKKEKRFFDYICVDLHGNSWKNWRKMWPWLSSRIGPGGRIVINNATLDSIPEWAHESGVRELGEVLSLDENWKVTLHSHPLPGVLVLELLS